MTGTQNAVITTNLPSFPWVPGDKLDAVPLNNQFIVLQQQIANLANQIVQLQAATDESHLGVSIIVNWGGNTSLTAGPYVLTGSSPYEFTLIDMVVSVGTNGGSFDVVVLDDGVPIAALSNITVSNPGTLDILASANTIIHRGSELDVVISNVVGAPQNSWINLNGTTNAFSEMVIGVGFGQAPGLSVAIGIGTSTSLGQTLGVATGTASVQAVGIGSNSGIATATGTNVGNGVGVSVATGLRVGTATGTSTATAVGSFTTGFPTFVMDDATVGVLDQNPLG